MNFIITFINIKSIAFIIIELFTRLWLLQILYRVIL